MSLTDYSLPGASSTELLSKKQLNIQREGKKNTEPYATLIPIQNPLLIGECQGEGRNVTLDVSKQTRLQYQKNKAYKKTVGVIQPTKQNGEFSALFEKTRGQKNASEAKVMDLNK